MGGLFGELSDALFGGQASTEIGNTGYGNIDAATAEQQQRAKEAELRKAAQADLTSANQDLAASRAGQVRMGEAADLAKQAALGQGPSAAQQLMQRGSDQAIAAQAAAAAGARGNPAAQAAAQRAAMGQMANVQGNTIADMAALRAKEQQAGMDLYAQQTGALTAAASRERGQGLGQAQMGLEAELKQRAMNDAQQQAAYELQHAQRVAQQQGDIATAQMKAGIAQSNAKNEAAGGETLFKAAVGAATASDTTLKKEKLLQQFELGKTKAPPGTLTRDHKPSTFLPGNAHEDPSQRDARMRDWMEEKQREEELDAKLQADRKGKPIAPYSWDDLSRPPIEYAQAPTQVVPSDQGVEPKPWESEQQWQNRLRKENPTAYQGVLSQAPPNPSDPAAPISQRTEASGWDKVANSLNQWSRTPTYVTSDQEYKQAITKMNYPQSNHLHHWMKSMDQSK